MDAEIVNLLNQAADSYGVPSALAIAIADQESGGNANAVSSRGAQGVMQLMPATAAALGVSNPFDPQENINAGVHYVAELLAQFSDPALAIAAYNWGPTNVRKYGYNNWPTETRNYVSSVLSKAGAALSPAPPTIDATTGQVIGPGDVDAMQAASMVPSEFGGWWWIALALIGGWLLWQSFES